MAALLMKYLVYFLVSVTICVDVDEIISSTGSPEDYVDDTQHAICKIFTEDVQTSANATVKRKLKGVCTKRQMNRNFKQLETRLLKEINNIKFLLTGTKQLSNKKNFKNYENYEENLALRSSDSDVNYDSDVVTVTEIITQSSSWSRTEISKLNDTIYTIKNEKVYSYYWEIKNIQYIMRKVGIHIRSPDIYVLGHQLCLQAYPNYQNSNYLGIQLRRSSNFIKKHRFTILDQFDETKDIQSQIMGGISRFEPVYQVPYEKLLERNYLHQDIIIIKVTIYLNS